MAERKKKSRTAFRKLVRNLCSINNPSYRLAEIRDSIMLSDNISPIEMQALLIAATNMCFTGETLSIDIILMSLGLLEGFDNYDMSSDQNDGGGLLKARQVKFLQESNYLLKTYSDKYTSYEVLARAEKEAGKKKTPLETVISTLGTKHGRYLDKVADRIYDEAETILSYINENKNNYLEEYKFEGKTRIRLKLPKLENRRQDKEPADTFSKKDPPIPPPVKELTIRECIKKVWGIFVLEFIIVALVFILTGIKIGHDQAIEDACSILAASSQNNEDGSVPEGNIKSINEYEKSFDGPFGYHHEEKKREIIYSIPEPTSSESK